MRSLTMTMSYCRCTRTRMAVAILVHLISTSSVASFSIGRAGVHDMRQTLKRGVGLRRPTSAQKFGASRSRGLRRTFSNGSKSAPMIPFPSLDGMQAKTTAAATTNPAVDRPGGSRLRSTAAFAATTSAEASSPSTTAKAIEPSVSKSRPQRLQVATFFFLWYLFNVGYNLTTKYTLTALPLPIMLAAVQLLTGVPYVWILWLTGLRKAPLFSRRKLQGVTPIAAAHTLAHLSAVVSIGAGAVGFVHIVKGAEPLFTSVLSVLTGSRMPWPVYLTLLPIIGGVGMASAGEISFSALAFAAAMMANASAASRSVLGKIFMAKEKKDGGTIDAGNLYAMMTMLGCLVLTPLAMALEGPKVAGVWDAALQAGYSPRKLINSGLLSGLYFYLYNEVSFYALNIVHPVTHALGNTLKRVVMITVSVFVLGHKFTPLGLVGCCTAICGVLSYSLAKAKLMSGGDKSDPVPVLAEVKAVNSTAAVAQG